MPRAAEIVSTMLTPGNGDALGKGAMAAAAVGLGSMVGSMGGPTGAIVGASLGAAYAGVGLYFSRE